jgi:chromosome segregation ATPase
MVNEVEEVIAIRSKLDENNQTVNRKIKSVGAIRKSLVGSRKKKKLTKLNASIKKLEQLSEKQKKLIKGCMVEKQNELVVSLLNETLQSTKEVELVEKELEAQREEIADLRNKISIVEEKLLRIVYNLSVKQIKKTANNKILIYSQEPIMEGMDTPF